MKTDIPPFRTSVMAQSAQARVLAILLLLFVLWAAIAWAVVLP